ncbi:MAG: TonB-dependent receptor [Spirochaetota bacterium]
MKTRILISLIIASASITLTAQTTNKTSLMTTNTVTNAAAASTAVPAVKADTEGADVVVTANRIETPRSQVGSSVTVITADDIKKSGAKEVQGALRTVAGITASQNGGFGSTASIFLRGLGSSRVLVMIDGIAANSAATSDHSFGFAHVPVDGIERIEIIRGPQSTLYGSDAMSGVINIITKKGKGAPQTTVSLEGGSFATFRGALDYSGRIGDVSFSCGGSHLRTEGVSKAVVTNGVAESDPYYLTTIVSRAEYKPFDTVRLFGSLHYTHARTSIDDGGYADDPNYINLDERLIASLGYAQRFNDLWGHSIKVGYVYSRNEGDDLADSNENTSYWYVNYGQALRIDWQNDLNFANVDILTVGASGLIDRLHTFDKGYFGFYSESELSPHYQRTISGYAQNHLTLWGIFNNTSGIRYDYSADFGGALTWKTSLAVVVSNIGLTVKGNFATGFKAPTSWQLYNTAWGGNTNLKPESLWSVDAGVHQELGRMLSVEATYFYTASSNMIQYNLATFKFENVLSAISRGVETMCTFSPREEIAFQAAYTYTDSADAAAGRKSDRIPAHKASIGVVGTLTNIGFGSVTFTYVGERPDAGAAKTLAQYYKLDAALTWIIDRWELSLRGENLLNQQYQEATGYASPGLSIYGGVKVKL